MQTIATSISEKASFSRRLVGWVMTITMTTLIFQASVHAQAEDDFFPADWFEAPFISPTAIVANEDAQAFLNHFFDVVNRQIFDPGFKAAELQRARQHMLSEISSAKRLTRSDVDTIIMRALESVHISHLASLTPEISTRLDKITRGEEEKGKAVSAEMRGELGILRVKSFLVPWITKAEVDRAMTALESARAILIDLRGNGGGSTSSVSYLAEYFLGPNKVLFSSRTRDGLNRTEAEVVSGYFSDLVNYGSRADIAALLQNGRLIWKTSPSAAPAKNRPTFVLTDRRCGSSCEIFVAAMKEHGVATILGDRTAGAVLGAIAFRGYWRGYIVLAPFSQVTSPGGVLYEQVGVVPDLQIEACAKPSGTAECFTQAMAIVSDRLVTH